MLYAKTFLLRVNSKQYQEFNKTCQYLHNIKRQNCCYDISSQFKYIIDIFNKDFNDFPRYYWKNQVELYNSKVKKDFEIKVCLNDHQYDEFIGNCSLLKMKRTVILRSLMLKLIEETKIE